MFIVASKAFPDGRSCHREKFFSGEAQGESPQVPSCEQCNREKSELEHYLTAVLPFAARHADALPIYKLWCLHGLHGKSKLVRQLDAGMSKVWSREPSGIVVPTSAIPFDGEKLEKLFALIVKGLMWHHWKVLLGKDCNISVMTPGTMQKNIFDELQQKNARARLNENLGEGTIIYKAAQGTTNPIISVWEFIIYGGARLTDAPAFQTSFCRPYAR